MVLAVRRAISLSGTLHHTSAWLGLGCSSGAQRGYHHGVIYMPLQYHPSYCLAEMHSHTHHMPQAWSVYQDLGMTSNSYSMYSEVSEMPFSLSLLCVSFEPKQSSVPSLKDCMSICTYPSGIFSIMRDNYVLLYPLCHYNGVSLQLLLAPYQWKVQLPRHNGLLG